MNALADLLFILIDLRRVDVAEAGAERRGNGPEHTALKCLMISLLEIASVFFLLHRGAFDVGPYQRQSVPLHRLTPQSLWPSPARRIRLETTVVAAFSATRPASEDAKAKAGRTCLRDGRLLPRSGNHVPAPSQLAATDTSPELMKQRSRGLIMSEATVTNRHATGRRSQIPLREYGRHWR